MAMGLTGRDSGVALLMIDADHFKQFNDQLGHQAGDECLRVLANTLQKHVSRPKTWSRAFGGEEFAILLPATPLEGAQRVAELIRAAVFDLESPAATRFEQPSRVQTRRSSA